MNTRIHSATFWLAVSASLLCGQTSANSPGSSVQPLPVKRVPAGKVSPQTQNASPLPVQNYDFGGQLRVLQDPTVLNQGPPATSVTKSAGADPEGKIPKDYQPRTDVPLNPTALEAVRVSEKWRGGENAPAAGADGRVLFSYAAGLPVVVCAPLRVCIIELQPGEKITGEPQVGDSVRWNISPAMYGQGEESTSVIVLKPQEPGLDTNLLIATDRRAYYLRLVSKPQDYIARVAFSYPEEENNQKWRQHLLAQQSQTRDIKRDAQMLPAITTVEKLNFSYKVKGGNEQLRPVRIFDDGAKTYIQMPPEVKNRETPVLMVLGSDGKGEMTNYRVQQQTYIVDRLFERAQLILGAGKKAQKVEITREQQPKG
jgi:type IV secretion system protein TrbG